MSPACAEYTSTQNNTRHEPYTRHAYLEAHIQPTSKPYTHDLALALVCTPHTAPLHICTQDRKGEQAWAYCTPMQRPPTDARMSYCCRQERYATISIANRTILPMQLFKQDPGATSILPVYMCHFHSACIHVLTCAMECEFKPSVCGIPRSLVQSSGHA